MGRGGGNGKLVSVPPGGFSFLPGGLAYSQGVRAEPGYAIEHVRFAEPVPVRRGFELIEGLLRSRQRPLTALCAVELRSPKPLSMEGFADFNRGYAGVLREWGLVRDGINAVARSNVAPVHHFPAEPSFFAFSFTVAADVPDSSFVVAGSSEWPEGGRFPEDVVCFGDTSRHALRRKAQFVLDAMHTRMGALGVDWTGSTPQLYSAHDQFDFFSEQVVPVAGGHSGVIWHYCRPPVVGWEFEMDVKRVLASRLFHY